jgi:Transposase DDE domain
LLNAVHAMIPEGLPVLLAGDRFYGTAALIRWCQEQGWGYRLRLKDHLILRHEGGEITTGEAAKAGITRLLNAELNESGVKTHLGILHEKSHPEPGIIALSEPPSQGRVLDYGMRWGIEPLFSDFKSRGFGITKTQLKHAHPIERLILVLTLALFWAASTGMPPRTIKHTQKKKKEA